MTISGCTCATPRALPALPAPVAGGGLTNLAAPVTGLPPDPSLGTPLQFQMPTAPTTAATAPASAATAQPSADPLAGFNVSGTAEQRQQLGTALRNIGSTGIGAKLLDAVRGHGIGMQIASDAEFEQATSGRATEAVGVFLSGGGAEPKLLVRASALGANGGATTNVAGGDSDDIEHVLAHELTHAAQHVAGEGVRTYAARAGADAARMGEAELRAGDIMMRESGAGFVATAVSAQLKDPVRFAQVAATNLGTAQASSWTGVERAYNPNGYALPTVVSPVATTLVQTGLQ